MLAFSLFDLHHFRLRPSDQLECDVNKLSECLDIEHVHALVLPFYLMFTASAQVCSCVHLKWVGPLSYCFSLGKCVYLR